MSGTGLAVVIALLVGLLAVGFVAWPLLGREDAAEAAIDDARTAREDELAEAQAALDRSLATIREIEQDHRAGNLSDDDFAALDRTERANAAELVRRRDALDAS